MSVELRNEDCITSLKMMPDNFIDVLVTDPPYGIGTQNKVGGADSKTKRAALTDYKVTGWDKDRPSVETFEEMLRISKNQIIFGGNYFADLLPASSCWIVWDKDNKSSLFADCELAWTSYKTAVRYFKYRWNGMLQGNMKYKEKRVHPTQKPLPLMEWVIENYTKRGDLILDPFMGSGSTGVACAGFGRSFIGIEKEKQFFDIAKERINKATAQLSF